MIKVKVTNRQALTRMDKLIKTISPSGMDSTVAKVAKTANSDLRAATPEKWTGETRKAWETGKKEDAVHTVTNPSKVFRILEYGRRAMAKPRVAKFFYIPLNKKAREGWTPQLRRGRDYILKRSVGPITPRRILRDYVPKAKELFSSMVIAKLRTHTAFYKK